MEKVSCLMITADRYSHFQSSFDCYCAQDYENKELVIIANGSEEYQDFVEQRVAESGRSDIRLVRVSRKLPIGALRNLSLDTASGPIVCQWDDDDISHPSRIRTQLEVLKHAGGAVSFLLDELQYFAELNQICWSDWVRAPRPAGVPHTLLGYREALPRYNDQLWQEEDALFQSNIFKSGVDVVVIRMLGVYYIYTFHGANVYPLPHHARLMRAYGLERDSILERRGILSSVMGDYGFGRPISVVDHLGGVVFTWEPSSEPAEYPPLETTYKVFSGSVPANTW